MALTKVSRGLLNTSIVDNGNATAITIDSSENVTFSNTVTADQASITGTAAGLLTLDRGASSNQIKFANAGSTLGYFGYRDGTGFSIAGSNGASDVVIDASGNLLVSKSASSFNAAGAEIRTSGVVIGTVDGAAGLIANRLTSDGALIQLSKDGTTVGSIGVESGDNFIIEATATDHAGLLLWGSGGSGRVTPRLNGSEANGTVDLGRSAGRFKDLYLSGTANVDGSVKYGAGANAGTLQNLHVSIGTSATLAIDMGDVVTSAKGAGFYMVSIVRTGGSYGRHFVGIFGVNSGSVVLYETLRSSGNVTVTVSGTQIKASSTSATNFDVNAIPLAVDATA